MSQGELEEPVVESAPLAHRIAPTLCVRTSDLGETCAWYHGFWQYLRAIGIAKTSGGQAVFLVDTLRSLIRSGAAARVLVSGSADYSMPAHVLFAFAREGTPVDLTALDRCETPLYLSRWYAERQRARIATVRSDILAYESPTPFDVVLTNSFFGNFDAGSRPRLVTAWRHLLRPGGSVLFTNRLRPDADASPVAFTTTQTQDFCDAVRREATRWQPVFKFDPEEVTTWARTYAERFRSYPLRSPDEVVSLLGDGGFSVDYVNVVSAPPHQGESLSGPSLAEKADYIQVRATRR